MLEEALSGLVGSVTVGEGGGKDDRAEWGRGGAGAGRERNDLATVSLHLAWVAGFVTTPGAGTQRKGGDWAADVMSADARERRVGTSAAEGGSRAHSAPRGVGRGSVREKTARPLGAKAEHLGQARGKDSAQRSGIPGWPGKMRWD